MKKHDEYKFDDLFLKDNYNKCFDIQHDEESDDDKTLENDKEEIANLRCIPLLESDGEQVKEGQMNQNLSSKQTINQTFISTNKSWK